MIAVTIGVGRYQAMADYAALAVRKMTGLSTVVLGEDHFANSGLSYPHFLKLRLFDLLDEEDLLFFDADMVCLNSWDPRLFAQRQAIVAVADRPDQPVVREACATWGIPQGEYFNTGLLILNRASHSQWLKEAELFVHSHALMPLYDQTPLNIVRHQLGLSLSLLDRRFNWIGFGEGSFCYQVPVFMAHTLCADAKRANLDFFEGRLRLEFSPQWTINEMETSKLRGRTLQIDYGLRRVGIQLRPDGTVGPFGSQLGGHYWCVLNGKVSPILAIASETEVVRTYTMVGADHWLTTEEARCENHDIAEFSSRLLSARWFHYSKGEHERAIELLPGGQIGVGASPEEQFWYVLEDSGEPILMMGADLRETCRLKWRHDLGSWEGRSLIRNQCRVMLSTRQG
jgi:hypothetical protein